MKKNLCFLITMTFCFSFIKSSFGQELKTEKIAEINILVNPPIMAGTKIIYTVKGGTVSGNIQGQVLPVGGDFATAIGPTTIKQDVRLVLQTQDSAIIYITYTGVIYADAETFKLMATGKEVSPSKYYIRNTPVFETKSPKY
ncbi:MAG: hypothetical protein JWQ09_4670, partial [Segetibacter sp.]|nr:hypothetical protein [Segetibacter sp.]